MGDRARWLRFNVHPTRQGCMVVVLGRTWNAGRPSSVRRGALHIALEEPLCLDDPGAALRALSDALAEYADSLSD